MRYLFQASCDSDLFSPGMSLRIGLRDAARRCGFDGFDLHIEFFPMIWVGFRDSIFNCFGTLMLVQDNSETHMVALLLSTEVALYCTIIISLACTEYNVYISTRTA